MGGRVLALLHVWNVNNGRTGPGTVTCVECEQWEDGSLALLHVWNVNNGRTGPGTVTCVECEQWEDGSWHCYMCGM